MKNYNNSDHSLVQLLKAWRVSVLCCFPGIVFIDCAYLPDVFCFESAVQSNSSLPPSTNSPNRPLQTSPPLLIIWLDKPDKFVRLACKAGRRVHQETYSSFQSSTYTGLSPYNSLYQRALKSPCWLSDCHRWICRDTTGLEERDRGLAWAKANEVPQVDCIKAPFAPLLTLLSKWALFTPCFVTRASLHISNHTHHHHQFIILAKDISHLLQHFFSIQSSFNTAVVIVSTSSLYNVE